MTDSVLVAESDAIELELIATVLARDGFKVLQVLERDAALEAFADESVTLVIAASDVSGRGGGAALCAEVKKLRPATKFVLLHPSGNDADVGKVLMTRTGCDAVLPSPFRYDALKRLLADWGFGAKHAAPTTMSFAVPPPDVPIPLPVVVQEPPPPVLAEYEGDALTAPPLEVEAVAVEPLPVEDTPVDEASVEVAPVEETPPEVTQVGVAPLEPPPPVEPLVNVELTDAASVDALFDFMIDDSSRAEAAPPAPPPVEAAPLEPESDAGIAAASRLSELVFEHHTPPEPPPPPEQAAEPTGQEPLVLTEIAEHADAPVPLEPPAPPEMPEPPEPPPLALLAEAPEVPEAPPPPPEPVLSETVAIGSPRDLDGDWLLARPTDDDPRDGFAGVELPPAPPSEDEAPPPQDAAPVFAPPVPPPPPREAEPRSVWAEQGASSWRPSGGQANSGAPRIEARGMVAIPAPPVETAVPPPPPIEEAPPPPPSEAFDETPVLALEGIAPRTPVGSEPRTTLPPSIPPEGDLTTTPLPRLLFELYGGTYCGTLRLSRKGIERVIEVWNGFPVAVTVTPNEDKDDLLALLFEHGRISPEQAKDAMQRAPGREAQLLVALGVIDERDLLDVIREQTELRLAASFSWRDGTYKITPSRAPPESVVSEIHPVKVIWRGVCEHYDVGSLLSFFSPLRARYIVATEVFPIHYQTLGPFLRRLGLAHLFDGKTTFEQALRSDDKHALEIAHTLYVLIVTEMVRAQSLPGAAANFPDTAPKRRQTGPVDYRALTQVCEDVARAYLDFKESDYFRMLEVSRQATDAEVASAYERLAKPFKQENLIEGLPEDVMRRAREIDGMLRRARDTLCSPDERRRYVARLDDTTPPPPPTDALAP